MNVLSMHKSNKVSLVSCLIGTALLLLTVPMSASAQTAFGTAQSTCQGNPRASVPNSVNNSQSTNQLATSGLVTVSNGFTVCVPVVLKKLHPGVKAAVVACEFFFSGMALPLAQGKVTLKPAKGILNQMAAVRMNFTPDSGSQTNAIAAFKSGNFSATPSYRCNLLLSSEESGAKAMRPTVGSKVSWLNIAGQNDETQVSGSIPLRTP